MSMNALANSKNIYQGTFKRVLCLCSAGLLRSPTMAVVLSQEPYNFNTRAAGVTEEYALVNLTHTLVHWADEIVMASPSIDKMYQQFVHDNKIDVFGKTTIVLDIPDMFSYRDPELVRLIKTQYDELADL